MVTIKTIVFLFFFIMALAFGTAESSTHLTDSIEKVTHGKIIVKPMVDTPVMAQYIYLIIIAVLLIDGIDLYLRANYSPQVMGAGLHHPYSFNGNVTELCGFGIIGGGGSSAPVPHDGSHYIIVPLTHLHRIGEHVVIEAVVTEDRPIDEAPVELKRHIRSMRGGLWGVVDIATGWFTYRELLENPLFTFTKNEKQFTIGTQSFITKDAQNAADYDIALQLSNNETHGLSSRLRMLSDVGVNELSGDHNNGWLKKNIFKRG